MSPANAEVHRLSSAISIWHRYDSGVKADLFSTAVTTETGLYLVDPIAIDMASLALDPELRISGVVVTNANHLRASLTLSHQLSVPIYSQLEAAISPASQISDGDHLSPDLTVVGIEGAAPGEIALRWAGEGGVLIVGDALINFGSHGFSFLPSKYCSNPNLMRKSLRRLLALSFSRMLFAHGTPIMSNARERLAALLDE